MGMGMGNNEIDVMRSGEFLQDIMRSKCIESS